MNHFVQFYEKHKISPVSQDIADMQKHADRRIALYRTLGLPPMLFSGKRVLEVGPGSGFNSIITATFEPESYVLVEPNTTGFEHTQELFRKHGLDRDNVTFINAYVEGVNDQEPFDIVLCEGMLHGIQNQEQVLRALDKQLKPGGVLVTTCSDALSYFFENCRRYVGRLLVEGVEEFSQQVELLSECYEPHLKTLKGRSRPVPDWVMDNLLNPAAMAADCYHSIEDGLHFFEDDYFFYSSSPAAFENMSWYKELPSEPNDFNQHYIQQMKRRAHWFVDYRSQPSDRDAELNQELASLCQRFADIDQHYERDGTKNDEVIQLLSSIEKNLEGYAQTQASVAEVRSHIEQGKPKLESVASSPTFASAFGRGMQYLSLVKKV